MPRRRRSVARWLRGLVLRGLCPAPSLDCVGGYWGVDVPFGVVGNGELSARGIFVEKSGTTVAQVSCNSPSTQAAQLACHPAAPPTQLPSSDSRSLGCTVSPRRGCSVAWPPWLRNERLSRLLHDEQAPFTGHALEVVRATIDELEVGAGDQVLDCGGDQYLIRRSGRCDAGPDMHRDTADIIAD